MIGHAELDQGFQALAQGQVDVAWATATGVLAQRPRFVQAHRLLGLCHLRNGDVQAAEAAFRAGLKLDRANDTIALDLADLLTATSRAAAAETTLRTALAANRRSLPLSVALAKLLTATARPEEALRLLAALPPQSARDHSVLAAQANAHKALGRPDAALAANRRAAELYPESPVAHHNLAATLGDLGHFAAAAQSSTRALARGGRAPQTFLVHARALLGIGRLDEAEAAFREAVRGDAQNVDAVRELVQLIWMRREDRAPALAVLDTVVAAQPDNAALPALRARILDSAGDREGAAATLDQAIARYPGQPTLHIQAAELAATLGRPTDALRHATHAATLAPDNPAAQTALIAACLASGAAQRAADLAEAARARDPLDQRAIAYQATAWRLLADPRYHDLYDYERFVRPWRMNTPDGWANLEAYLADLASVLAGLHPFRTHPLDQSVRHGSQATHLLASENPTIRAFFQAIDGPIRQHLAMLGEGPDPLRTRNTGAYRYHGAWSVRLRPGGFHTDHIHPEGWISSACYITLPETTQESREGWIKFGEPGIPTAPKLAAEHYIQPEPGMLALFPSYMWHGTVPFTQGGVRLSVAFDLVPR